MKSQNVNRITELFFRFSYAPEVVRKVQGWMVGMEREKEKEEALFRIWEGLKVEAGPDSARSWEMVRERIGLTTRRSYAWGKLLRNVAAVVMPLFFVVGAYLIFWTGPQKVEVVTQNNEQRHFRLPDGSKIWLNSGSRISYLADFDDSTRLVELSGEAYFKVYPDQYKPFVVRTANLEIRALGTEFNVNAYPLDSRAVATLNSGKIQIDIITEFKGEKQYILSPRQQMVLYKDKQETAIRVLSSETGEWKNGALVFQDATLTDMVHALERQYDVRIEFQASDFPKDQYSVKFTDGEDAGQVLQVLQDMVGFQCVKKSARIYQLK